LILLPVRGAVGEVKGDDIPDCCGSLAEVHQFAIFRRGDRFTGKEAKERIFKQLIR
jgi:hypothetical protein